MIALAPTPVLHTERLTLRAPQAADWPAFRGFILSDRAAFVRPDDIDEGKAWRAFGHIIGHWVLRGWGLFVVTPRGGDTALAGVGPWFPAGWPEAEIGWSVWDAGSEGRGIAFEAARAVQAHVFGPLGWRTAVSYIDPANSRSRLLAQKLGCVLDAGAPFPGDHDHPVEVWRHPAGGAA